MKKLLVIATMILGGFAAHAQQYGENSAMALDQQQAQQQLQIKSGRLAWTCGMNFRGTSRGVKLIVGKFKTVATGRMSCVNSAGKEYNRAIRLTMGTGWFGPAAGIGDFEIAGSVGQLSLFNYNPDIIFGRYAVAQGQVGAVLGAGAFTAVRVGPPQLSLNVSTQILRGTGVQLGLHTLDIEPLN